MKTVKNLRPAWSAAATVALLLGASSSATAYIDAGSGSYIFQLLVGALVGSAVAIKVFWRRVSSFFAGKQAKKR